MRTRSKTDKKRLHDMRDKDINLDDIPELDDEFFKNAQLQLLSKQAVTMRLDSDVLEWFKNREKAIRRA